MDTWAFISNLSPKDVIVPLLSGLGGWLAALRMTRSNEKIAREEREREQDGDVTRRVRLLLDGYERRIAELKAEVEDLRNRVEVCERRWRERDALHTGP